MLPLEHRRYSASGVSKRSDRSALTARLVVKAVQKSDIHRVFEKDL